jgi:predicted nuclease of predicted toxin-antitoxin system
MQFLIDACVGGSVVLALRDAGFDVEWVAEWERDPGDMVILRYAHKTERVFVTRDKDFGALIFRDKQPHSGVLRIAGEMKYAEQVERVLQAIRIYAGDLERCYMVTVETDRVRVSQGAPERSDMG